MTIAIVMVAFQSTAKQVCSVKLRLYQCEAIQCTDTSVQQSESVRKMQTDKRSSTRASTNTSAKILLRLHQNPSQYARQTTMRSWRAYWARSTPTSPAKLPLTASPSRATIGERRGYFHLPSKTKHVPGIDLVLAVLRPTTHHLLELRMTMMHISSHNTMTTCR